VREKGDEGSRKNGGDQGEHRRRRPHAALARGHQIVAGGTKVVQRSCVACVHGGKAACTQHSPWPGLAENSTARIIARARWSPTPPPCGYFCAARRLSGGETRAKTDQETDRTDQLRRLRYQPQLSIATCSLGALRRATAGHRHGCGIFTGCDARLVKI
jgi:hypothetical protein